MKATEAQRGWVTCPGSQSCQARCSQDGTGTAWLYHALEGVGSYKRNLGISKMRKQVDLWDSPAQMGGLVDIVLRFWKMLCAGLHLDQPFPKKAKAGSLVGIWTCACCTPLLPSSIWSWRTPSKVLSDLTLWGHQPSFYSPGSSFLGEGQATRMILRLSPSCFSQGEGGR